MHSWDQNAGWAGGAALGSDRFWLTSLLHHILYVCFYVFCKRRVSSRCHVLFSLHTHSLSGACYLPLCGQGTCSLPPPRAPDLVMQHRQRIPRYIPAPPKDDQPAPLALQQVESARVPAAKRPKKGRKAKNWILCFWASACMRLTGPT